jgi:hypothetical protein
MRFMHLKMLNSTSKCLKIKFVKFIKFSINSKPEKKFAKNSSWCQINAEGKSPHCMKPCYSIKFKQSEYLGVAY